MRFHVGHFAFGVIVGAGGYWLYLRYMRSKVNG